MPIPVAPVPLPPSGLVVSMDFGGSDNCTGLYWFDGVEVTHIDTDWTELGALKELSQLIVSGAANGEPENTSPPGLLRISPLPTNGRAGCSWQP